MTGLESVGILLTLSNTGWISRRGALKRRGAVVQEN